MKSGDCPGALTPRGKCEPGRSQASISSEEAFLELLDGVRSSGHYTPVARFRNFLRRSRGSLRIENSTHTRTPPHKERLLNASLLPMHLPVSPVSAVAPVSLLVNVVKPVGIFTSLVGALSETLFVILVFGNSVALRPPGSFLFWDHTESVRCNGMLRRG